jgi:hypothetical protein
MGVMFRRWVRWDQMEEVNWEPRSEVRIWGRPKREIQWEQRASAQAEAVVEERGMASAQRVVQSMRVRMCVLPCEGGRGPTMSTWTREKRREGIGMGTGEVCVWRCIFAFWQEIHWRVHWFTSRAMEFQRKREEMRHRVARMPGCPREWTCSKIWRRQERGTRGRKVEKDTSPRRDTVEETGSEVMEREGFALRGGMDGQVCCSCATWR